MKKKIGILLFVFCFLFTINVYAEQNINVKSNISGNVEKGKQIEINIDIDNIESLYAASFYFKYDPKVLRIDEIIPGQLISDPKISKFEAINDIDTTVGKVSYGFTCMGNINGFSGKGNLLKLKATVLEDKDFKVTSKYNNKTPNEQYTVAMQICDENIVELPYVFKDFIYTAKPQDKSDKVNTSNTKTDTVKPEENKEPQLSNTTEVKEDNNATNTINNDNKSATNYNKDNNELKEFAPYQKAKLLPKVLLLGFIVFFILASVAYRIYKKKK